jgi:hypothetical protein
MGLPPKIGWAKRSLAGRDVLWGWRIFSYKRAVDVQILKHKEFANGID